MFSEPLKAHMVSCSAPLLLVVLACSQHFCCPAQYSRKTCIVNYRKFLSKTDFFFHMYQHIAGNDG